MSFRVTPRSLVFAAALCGAALPAHAQGSFPDFPDANLKAGKAVWVDTCRDCHANPLSDAPQVKDTAQWKKRAAKGRPALYASALKGLVTPNTEMPPRGGKVRLTDEEVRRAVDYMLAITTGPAKE